MSSFALDAYYPKVDFKNKGDPPKYFDVLRDLLFPSESMRRTQLFPATAAAKIDALVLESGETGTESALWEVWTTFMHVAVQLNHDHPAMDLLVELVKALGQLPARTVTIWEADHLLWSDYPLLGPTIREMWIGE